MGGRSASARQRVPAQRPQQAPEDLLQLGCRQGPSAYLLDAAARAAVAPERPHPAPSDWLLGDIAHRLRSAGCAVRLRYGSGSDAIPMVVGGQGESGFRLAVVTDEASAAGSASLRDRVRWQHARLDLSDQLRSKAKAPHLNEYAHAQGLPAKLMAPWELGEAAERGKDIAAQREVRERADRVLAHQHRHGDRTFRHG